MKSKPLKFIDGDENKAANKMDGDLMIDAILELSKYDELILLAGDCDYDRLVDHVSGLPKQVHVLSYADRLSHELKMRAIESAYVTSTLIDELRSILEQLPK